MSTERRGLEGYEYFDALTHIVRFYREACVDSPIFLPSRLPCFEDMDDADALYAEMQGHITRIREIYREFHTHAARALDDEMVDVLSGARALARKRRGVGHK